MYPGGWRREAVVAETQAASGHRSRMRSIASALGANTRVRQEMLIGAPIRRRSARYLVDIPCFWRVKFPRRLTFFGDLHWNHGDNAVPVSPTITRWRPNGGEDACEEECGKSEPDPINGRSRIRFHDRRWRMAKRVARPLAGPRFGGEDDFDVTDYTGWLNVLPATHGAPLSCRVPSARRRGVAVARLPIRGLPKMKAGSAGSNPDGVTLEEKKIHSQPFQILLRDIGEAVFTLNTAVVGLDAVERGHQKPATLNISWEPKDRKIAARKSRKFILESTMVRVSEVINQFVSALSKLPKFKDEKKEGGNGTSEKVAMIPTRVLEKDDYLIPGVVLLVHWRNRIVHPNSNTELKPQQKKLLLSNKDIIAE